MENKVKEKIIGIDYEDLSFVGKGYEVEITVVEGFKPLYYKKVYTKELKDVFAELVLLSFQYNAKINFETQLLGLYYLFYNHNSTELLRDNTIPRILNSGYNEKVKGFTNVKCLKDMFKRYSTLLTYNKEFEESYRIAVMPYLYENSQILREITILKNNIE